MPPELPLHRQSDQKPPETSMEVNPTGVPEASV